ncbi:hypothetical protein BV25DRAFT_360444 [Artomyces pyxidatus]|uniref:Uncharacterized protein n=1 Tax=Artomyces pyxidatus TaxID=48021 RepID=A0ACB8T747_9AGAM|nr:hypothetical protein BV25DRAFT_360444 [Artomyces pyxidatus]
MEVSVRSAAMVSKIFTGPVAPDGRKERSVDKCKEISATYSLSIAEQRADQADSQVRRSHHDHPRGTNKTQVNETIISRYGASNDGAGSPASVAYASAAPLASQRIKQDGGETPTWATPAVRSPHHSSRLLLLSGYETVFPVISKATDIERTRLFNIVCPHVHVTQGHASSSLQNCQRVVRISC